MCFKVREGMGRCLSCSPNFLVNLSHGVLLTIHAKRGFLPAARIYPEETVTFLLSQLSSENQGSRGTALTLLGAVARSDGQYHRPGPPARAGAVRGLKLSAVRAFRPCNAVVAAETKSFWDASASPAVRAQPCCAVPLVCEKPGSFEGSLLPSEPCLNAYLSVSLAEPAVREKLPLIVEAVQPLFTESGTQVSSFRKEQRDQWGRESPQSGQVVVLYKA